MASKSQEGVCIIIIIRVEVSKRNMDRGAHHNAM